jgi:hypothetical protein
MIAPRGKQGGREGESFCSWQKRMIFGGPDDDDDDDNVLPPPPPVNMTRKTVTASAKIAMKRPIPVPASGASQGTKAAKTGTSTQRHQGPVFEDISPHVLGTLSTYDKKVRSLNAKSPGESQ